MIRIFWGLIAVLIGTAIVMKTEWIVRNMGRMDFFETKLSTWGGSRTGYKLVGLAAIFIGIMMITNMTEGFVEWVANLFLPESNQIRRY